MGFALQQTILDRDNETVIVGLGETGLSVANYFQKLGKPFVIVDSRISPPKLKIFKESFSDVHVKLGEFSVGTFKYAKEIIISPGVDVGDKFLRSAIKQGAVCIGDIELFVSCTQIPIVAITGSNGKSTVTSLVAEMANSSNVKSYAGGNLGPPALDLLKHEDAQLFALELSSFQLESTCSLKTQVSAVLNISPDHLDRHKNKGRYAKIKEKIFEGAKIGVINRDDPIVSSMNVSGETINFGLDRPTGNNFGLIKDVEDQFLAKGEERLLATSELAMHGQTGILNSLAALAIGNALDLPMEKMLLTLSKFNGLPHRFALVRELNEVSWFNDSKGTNPGATISTLKSLGSKVILLAGGVHKGGDLDLLKNAVSKHVKQVILFGQDANIFMQALCDVAETQIVNSMHEAVIVAHEISEAGDNVLLSPACASFDMYENYIDRGNDFEMCVMAL